MMKCFRKDKSLIKNEIFLILLLAAINGMIFWLVVPPWWHYDEPGHFEYAWLLANHPDALKTGEVDQSFRAELGKSLEQFNWYSIRNYKPSPSSSQPIWIGASQYIDLPGYYFLLSLPLRLVRGTSITFQYNVCRLISFLLYLATVFLSWKITKRLFSPENPLIWIIPCFLSILPGFVDIMTSVSNDVAAVFSFTLLLYSLIQILTSKFKFADYLLLGLSLICCYYSKNIDWLGFVLVPFVLLFKIIPKPFHKVLLYLGGVFILAFCLLGFDFNGAADWFSTKSSDAQTIITAPTAVSGKKILSETYTPDHSNGRFGQCLPMSILSPLQNQQITYGAWIWGDQEAEIQSPYLNFPVGWNAVTTPTQIIKITGQPQFYSFNAFVPENAAMGCFIVHPANGEMRPVNVYYDGAILVQGTFSKSPPRVDPSTESIIWDNQKISNLLSNSSFEQTRLQVKPWVEKIGEKVPYIADNVSFLVSMITIPKSFGWYFSSAGNMIFRTFWGDIAGDKVILPGRYTYSLIFVVVLIGMIGFLTKAWKARKKLPIDIAVILALSVMLMVGATMVRGISSVLDSTSFPAWARYFMPAITPIAMILCIGWKEMIELVQQKLRIKLKGSLLFFAGMYGIFLASIYSALQYFHPWVSEIFLLVLEILLVFGLYQAMGALLKMTHLHGGNSSSSRDENPKS